ncbi:MAG: transporter [Burkholderiaceae bacterium]|nr:transporter [Burkholderiaceae bacterium]
MRRALDVCLWACGLQGHRLRHTRIPLHIKQKERSMRKILLAAMISWLGLFATACSVTSGQQGAAEYVDDATITAQVKTRFAEDKTVAATRIQVETLKGTVQLSGFATSEAERQRAAQLAAAVPGVKQVQNGVVVQPPKS